MGRSTPKAPYSAFNRLRRKVIEITVDSRRRKLTPDLVLEFKTYEEAIQGKVRATREVLRWVKIREEARRKAAGHAGGIIFLSEHAPSNSINEALLLLGVASTGSTHGPAYLKLEPWAIQQALDRANDREFSNALLRELQDHVTDPAEVVWPEGSGDG